MEQLLTIIGSGVISGLIVVVTLKTDNVWMKQILKNHEDRLLTLERKR